MMIMAQHPTQQKAQAANGVVGSNKTNATSATTTTITKQCNPVTTRQNHMQLLGKANKFVAKISTTTPQIGNRITSCETRHPQQATAINDEIPKLDLNNSDSNRESSKQLQDGKRTLIKNQLYLIEQLQLENANLRNERDQLQMENEELKFQLQMISSSNILGQSGHGDFDDRQLSTLVESTTGRHNDMRTGHDCRLTTASATHQQGKSESDHGALAFGLNHLIQTTNTCCDSQGLFAATNCSALTKITATPVRHPMNLIGCDDVKEDKQQSLVSSSGDIPSRRRLLSASNHDLSTPLKTCNIGDVTPMTTVAKSLTSTPTLNKKLLSRKSISLSAFNIKTNPSTGSSSTQHMPQDDARLVDLDENDDPSRSSDILYSPSENSRVQTAVIIIQRAYREYRICKRFRTITEQLRHTSRSSNAEQQGYTMKSDHDRESDHLNDSGQSNPTISDKNSSTDSVPYASGATRAAAYESLTQAANHLARGAAAATAAAAATNRKKQNATVNGVTGSASCQQVSSIANGLNVLKSATSSVSIDSEKPRSQVKSDSVVAAAINFQQLESMRKRQYRVGLNIFNKNPESGISFLIAHSFIDCSTPYNKASTSYYLSNQLHFMDKQKLTAHQQSIHPSKNAEASKNNSSTLSSASSVRMNRQQHCRLCQEEENLKRNIARFLLHRKGLAKEKIGEYLGNLQSKFIQDVLVYYLQELDFHGMQIDVALRKFSSTFRMPGEAQKIERFVDRFACRYVESQQAQPTQNSQDYISSSGDAVHIVSDDKAKLFPSSDQSAMNNPEKNNLTMLSKDEIFILTFAIIMLNTDLHSPSLKSTTRMSANQFVNNLRGVFKSQMIHENDLIEIYERVKANQITTSPDHVTHVMKVQQGLTANNFQKKEIPNLCVPHRRLVCFCRLFEVYDVTKKERLGQHQREIFLFNDILLVTKLARRARANAPQQYTYRQSIPLQGLYVQLSQSVHYNFGIKLCRRSNNETVIMFNARNELDQGRFVDDLNESISEMDEMEHIKTHNIVESIHLKQLDRLRRHTMIHEPTEDRRKLGKTSPAMDEKVTIMEDNEANQDNISGISYSSFNNDSAAGSLMALCTKPAKMRCTVTIAAPPPMAVEPLDK